MPPSCRPMIGPNKTMGGSDFPPLLPELPPQCFWKVLGRSVLPREDITGILIAGVGTKLLWFAYYILLLLHIHMDTVNTRSVMLLACLVAGAQSFFRSSTTRPTPVVKDSLRWCPWPPPFLISIIFLNSKISVFVFDMAWVLKCHPPFDRLPPVFNIGLSHNLEWCSHLYRHLELHRSP